ncbi:MAG: hypothetical protein FIB05_02370 [Betaproteobacteria bacterium]|nr:hypothetical protein [Betaproteobacteria bacterium]PWB59549.1 MAG: hypothetical protein C3F16_11950 [Betaproteobacteria bacterium]
MKASNLTKIALAVALAVPAIAAAESNFVSGATPLSANAKLNIQVTIPKILFLQVGTGTYPNNVATVDTVSISVPAANVGDGTSVAAGATVAVRVRGNGGNVTLNSNTPGPLLNDSGDQLAFTTISATTDNASLGHPAFAAAGNGTAVTLTATNRVFDQTANWTFRYSNAAVVAEGTYGGTAAKQGQVTYTASLP